MYERQNYSGNKENEQNKNVAPRNVPSLPMFNMGSGFQVPEHIKSKLDEIKKQGEKFKKRVLELYPNDVYSITILPPVPPKNMPSPNLNDPKVLDEMFNRIDILVVFNDLTMPLKERINFLNSAEAKIKEMSSKLDANIAPFVRGASEIFQDLLDGKFGILKEILFSTVLYDKGFIEALKVAEIHKQAVLQKFEKYIVTYVLAGSLVQGRATEKSDIDVFVVIDDTDVKRMTRFELKEKLRGIIWTLAFDACRSMGIENKLNVQVYLLTDFWEAMKEASPVILTFLRDGVPLHDKGIFLAWKQLLKLGRIKPSKEAIEMYKSTGNQLLDKVQFKLNEIAIEDFFWALINPSQAALMLYGLPPPIPAEAPKLLEEVFVKKEKLLEEKYPKILEKVLKLRKAVEHGDRKYVKGAEIDKLLEEAKEYLDRINKLFKEIEGLKDKDRLQELYDNVVALIQDFMKQEGKAHEFSKDNLLDIFNEYLVKKGYVDSKLEKVFKALVKTVPALESGKVSKSEISMLLREGNKLLKAVREAYEEVSFINLKRRTLRVVYEGGKKQGELVFLGDQVFIFKDKANANEVEVGELTKDNVIKNIKKSSYESYQEALKKLVAPTVVKIDTKLMASLEEIFGEDVQILPSF